MATKKKLRGRRGHGEGSIYQRASDGKWVAVVDLGYVTRPDGTRRRKRQTIYGDTRKEVADKLPALVIEKQRGNLPPEQQTVATFLETWLTQVVAESVRPQTYHSYRNRIELYIKPQIGDVVLSKLAAQHIQKLMASIIRLAPGTRRHIRAVLRIALNYAVRMEYINRNPVAAVPPPAPRMPISQILQPEEAQQLLDVVRGDRLEALYTVALAIGLRRGEIAALRWQDVDLARGVLRVERTLMRLSSKLTSVAPKSSKSRRQIELPSVAIAALRQHKMQQEMERQVAGSKWIDTGYVFTTRIGTPFPPEHLGDELHRHLARAGLPPIRLHDLRHSCASFLLAQGVPVKAVQEILGHSNINITLEIYGHLLKDAHRDAADKMDELLRKRAT